jgi:hypothetical protein
MNQMFKLPFYIFLEIYISIEIEIAIYRIIKWEKLLNEEFLMKLYY